MAKDFFNIDKGINLKPRASLPSDPQNGDIVYLLSTHQIMSYQDGAWSEIGGGVGNAIQFFEVEDIPRTATNTLLASLNPSDKFTFKEISVEVTQVFDGTPTLTIGHSGDNDAYFLATDIDLTKLGIYKIELREEISSLTDVRCYITGGSTTGVVDVELFLFGE